MSCQILKNWLERKRAISVQGLIETIRHWEKDGYIYSELLWAKLRGKVDLDSIQQAETVGNTAIDFRSNRQPKLISDTCKTGKFNL